MRIPNGLIGLTLTSSLVVFGCDGGRPEDRVDDLRDASLADTDDADFDSVADADADDAGPDNNGPKGRAENLEALIEGIVKDDLSVPGVILTVVADGATFSGSAGRFEFGGAPLKETDLFRAASITKTFTSAAMMVLVEDGKVDLDMSIESYLNSATIGVLEAGGYAPDVITVRQLLGHTAGIYDYTDADAYYAAIRQNPSRVWTRAEQVAVAMDEGEPLNDPGAEFHYGDTHYVLAGEILEEVTGLGLAEALRSLLRYEALGLTDTWLETLESPPAGAEARISHPYIGAEDTRAWHASWDLYGGGGLVTSTADMVRFFSALFGGRVFAKPETLEAWLEVPPVAEGAFFGMDGGMGFGRFELDGGGTCYAGFGFFSTVIVICPDKNFVFAGTANQAEPAEPDALLDGVLEVLLAE